ncbi:sulfotransferase family 2 domain-containing protein [Campylobacter jejuni]|uniref:sulfotransferase family 2 domain-containing protein n=1 Tax=Campylobacter jejuni TaxID=197 RepID=UPI000F80A751|nr:sulfotransferase family 2 domain-containing protein [Campylobacter jejuni]RTI85100.1 alpha-2,3-sialyltransferase [Campylobacter jejuni]
MFKDYHDKYGCIFIHVPKVAGTSIERVVFETDKWLVGHVRALDYINQDKNKFESYFSFAFVRNPFDRMVSAFHYLKKGGRNDYDKNWADENLKNFDTFEQFVLALKNKNIKDKILSWQHFTPQYKFICDENKNILVNFIGKLENINNDFKIVKNELNFDRNLIHSNSSKHEIFSNYYNEKTYNIIAELYKEDFALFDYDLEYKESIYKNSDVQFLLNMYKEKLFLKNKEIEKLRLLQFKKNKEINSQNNIISQQTNQIHNLNKTLNFQNHYGKAKARIQNQLSYKLGQALILNSKSVLGYLSLPFIILSIIISHKQEQKAYKFKVRKNPNLALPPLKTYPDYNEALKIKNHFSYQLGKEFIRESKNWHKGGLFLLPYRVFKLYKKFRKKQ